jgi:NAD(P)H-binding
MILVVGATGWLGTEICRRLRARGHATCALVREGSPKEPLLRELVQGDLKDPRSLQSACRGVHVVITTANACLAPDGRFAQDGGFPWFARAAGGCQNRHGHAFHLYVALPKPAGEQSLRPLQAGCRGRRALEWTVLDDRSAVSLHGNPRRCRLGLGLRAGPSGPDGLRAGAPLLHLTPRRGRADSVIRDRSAGDQP